MKSRWHGEQHSGVMKKVRRLVLTNAPVALRMGEINKLAEAIQAPVIGADVTNMDDLKKLFEESMKHFGGQMDFILHSIGMSINMRKGKSYTEIDYGFNQKSLDISAISLHSVLRTGWDMDAINYWGSVVALTYIAAQRVFPDYNEMADAKALLESITRSFGYHYGIKEEGAHQHGVPVADRKLLQAAASKVLTALLVTRKR